ncbi:Acyl-coenzyme A oxidase 1, peroxisomal, putative [Pediculus humanus corporis]|uniref:Acyl-coenzyme A oxidase n=1 Tax=Pediculus humanus subsp. corporis TaxID=121224 RepID=E0W4E2_PEDHC|nr:Acyl-coenzyme A oxidase 1, peroxisomal, putative [Pediculus humanus corporis]EEB20498.1 Acyl-coenzyme A oxidase 1, peroxisomal, putative [Pediculus humanus corporis]
MSNNKTEYRGKKTINPDLIRERENCTFDPIQITYILDEDPKKTEERRKMEDWFLKDPRFQEVIPSEYLSHKEKYEEAVRKACLIFKKLEEMDAAFDSYSQVLGQLGSAVLKDGNPFTLHYVMFIPTILGQGTLQQQAHWVGRAWNKEIIGTYAQTELGHGTFIRGLETTAHYDEKKKEFVLNSPTLTSYKWWPGGLGQTANYAVVVAQLYTKNECHGIHPFIVQLRHEKTHKPMPGIKIGEIGTKLGMNSTNNGYLGFDHVRIPRENMLMKNSKVLEDGTYVKAPSSKLTYGTMMFVRVVLVKDAASMLGKAVTIATRYSAVRRQSELKPGEPEPQILDYRAQQFKLFPNIATVFCFRAAASWLWQMYNNVTAELEGGDLDRLPELHSIACCMKAVCTSDAAKGIETVRMACGGHGYMTCSNLPLLYGLCTAMCTYEGENTVLLLQTARYLVKQFQGARSGGKLTPTLEYIRTVENQGTTVRRWDQTMESILLGFKEVSVGKLKTAVENLEKRQNDGIPQEDAWNMSHLELTGCAEAHCRAFLVSKFYESVEKLNPSSEVKSVLRQLSELYALYWILEKLGDFLRFSSLESSQVGTIQKRLEDLLAQIRPNAVGIVDGFDYCDEVLNSALGSYDGRVYERLFEEASKSPLNKQQVNGSFSKYVKPLLKSKM